MQPKITELNAAKNVPQKETDAHKEYAKHDKINVGKASFDLKNVGRKSETPVQPPTQ